MVSEELARVKRAHRKLERASREYREALLAGREAGASFGQLARAAGVSRQAVEQLLARRRGGG